MSYLNDYTTIAHALAHIDAHDRDTWVRIGMAVKSELGEGGFELWRDWSAKAPSYNKKAAIATWKSFKPTGGVTIASLFHEAKAGGWKSDSPYTPQPKPSFDVAAWLSRKQRESTDASCAANEHIAAAKRASFQWEHTNGPAIANHPYCKRKHIQPKGARCEGGTLLIPMYDQGHRLVSLQEIDGNGSKLFMKGGKVKGSYGMVCDYKEHSPPIFQLRGGEVMLCEGWATACTLYAKHKLPVFVAFTAGNLAAVAKLMDDVLSSRFTKVWVCGDVDESGTGQKAAAAAMANIHFRKKELMLPEFTNAQKTAFAERCNGKMPSDHNDLLCIERGLV